MTFRGRRRGAVGALAALAVAACSTTPEARGPAPTAAPSDAPSGVPATPLAGAEDCPALAALTVDRLQTYLDGFAGVTAEQLASVALESGPGLEQTAAETSRRAAELDCESDDLVALLTDELDRLEPEGPVAEAVAATLRADLLGTIDPSDVGPQRIEVATVAELLTAVRTAGSGSTIRITAPRLELAQPLVVLRRIRIVGAGADATVVRSTAEAAAVLSLADGTLGLADLTVEHVGETPASLLVIRRGGYDLARVRLVGGRADPGGGGGFGVVLRPDERAPRTDVARTLSDVELDDNTGGGILLSLDEAPAIDGLTVTGAGACGVCYLEDAAGTLTGARIAGPDVGVLVVGSAAPTITRVRIDGGSIGLGLTGTGTPTIIGGRVSGSGVGIEVTSGQPVVDGTAVVDAGEVGIRVTDGTPRLRSIRVSGSSPVGLVVLGGSPEVTGLGIVTGGEVGIAFGGASGGTVTDGTVNGPRIGVQVAEASTVAFSGLTVARPGDAAVLVTDTATPALVSTRCVDGAARIVVVVGAEPSIDEVTDCDVVEQEVAPEPDEG